MRSPHSGLLTGVLFFSRSDMMMPLGPFGGALGVAALPVMGVFVCVRIGLHQSKVWQISFWCSPIVCRAFGWWGLVAVCICAFWCGWCSCSVVALGSLGCLLGLLCLVLCLRLCSACLRGLMDDETSSHYIFLFMLLLIPFHVIGLSIKALLYIFIAWGLEKYLF